MKKTFTLFIMSIIALAVNAQEPLWTAKGYVCDPDWGEEYPASKFAFTDVDNVTVEGYADHVIVRGFCGYAGYDLVVYFEKETIEGEETCTITEISQIVNGQPAEPNLQTYEGYTYQYLEVGDSNYSFSFPLGDDGSAPYYSEFCDDPEDGYLQLCYIGLQHYTTEWEDSDAEYYVLFWPQEESVGIRAAASSVSRDAYNLVGQKVGADYKGIVIANGKKVVR